MIAANYRRHPDALVAQLCLDFGALLRWATARPGSRLLRAIRAARAASARAHAQVPPWIPPLCEPEAHPMPTWVRARIAASRMLARIHAAAQLVLA